MKASLIDFVGADAIARVIRPDGVASRLPGLVFRDKEFLALEYRRWLRRTWVFVGRGVDLPDAGDAAECLEPASSFFALQ